ncbi:extracellular solute-binding protein [Propionivibrio sp.]|uniref:extracellular solute-binding protein n=1 Tax=Propionivibrio sp. TaxID=2212460 RepID=UPI00272E4551|nr:extracellular solute-binding protein [Propionivibrio sp.]
MKKVVRTLCAVLVAAGFAGVSQAQTASKKLVVYCPHPLVFIEPIVKKFEAVTGIQTEVVAAGTGELLKRVEAEAANPLTDVMWGGTLSVLEPSKKFFESYQSPEAASFVDEAKDPDGKITGFTLVPSVLMVNTKLIGNIKVEGYQDLLNPALKGKIAFADPSKSSSSFEHVVNMLYAMGKGDPEKGWAFVQELAKNLDGKLLSGSSAVYKGVADGEYTVGLTFEEGAATYVKSKAPVKIVYMNEGVISKADGTAIVKGAKNLENAKKFVDFVSSKETQTMIAAQLNRRSVRKDVPPGEGLMPLPQIKLIKDNTEVVNKSKRQWLEKFKDIYTSL